MKNMKKIISLFLCALMIASVINFNVVEKASAFNGEDAETLTKDWYGGLDQILIEDVEDESSVSKEIKKLLADYLEIRELSFNKPSARVNFDIFDDCFCASINSLLIIFIITSSIVNVDISDDTGRDVAQFIGTGFKL